MLIDLHRTYQYEFNELENGSNGHCVASTYHSYDLHLDPGVPGRLRSQRSVGGFSCGTALISANNT